jgi:hypothetical protein
MANVVTGRQIKIDSTGELPINCNLKVTDATWFNATTGAVLTITDSAGRVLTWICYATNYPIDLGKLGWLSGPITVTEIDSGIAYLFMDK